MIFYIAQVEGKSGISKLNFYRSPNFLRYLFANITFFFCSISFHVEFCNSVSRFALSTVFFFASFSSVSDVRDAMSATMPAALRADCLARCSLIDAVACLIARGHAFNRETDAVEGFYQI